MPRSEVTQIFEYIKLAAGELENPELLQIECCGSYRRGRDFCGDADIIITRNDDKPIIGFVAKIVKKYLYIYIYILE